MGANFMSVCHKCRVYTSHLRAKEDVGRTLTKFYHDHYKCGRLNPENVQTHWDYFEEPNIEWDDWGYRDMFDEYYPELAASMRSKDAK